MVSDLTNLIIGIDESPPSRRAFEWACRQVGDGTVAAVHAIAPMSSLFLASAMIDHDPVRAHDTELLEGEWTKPPSWSTATITTAIVDDDVVGALTAAASGDESSVIAVGHHAGGHHLGHVASHLLRVAEQPVVIVPSDAAVEPVAEMVVVALHELAGAERTLIEFGAHLAAQRTGQLRIVSVVGLSTMYSTPVAGYGYGLAGIDPAEVTDATSQAVDDLVRETAERWPDVQVSGRTLTGHPVTTLAESAVEAGADVVVVGNHHHSAVTSLITDSVLHRLPAHLSCPIIGVRVR